MGDSPLPRKLAAILYADVAGYSRLTGEDEEGTHKALSAHLDRVARQIEGTAGRVVHYAGDAVLAEFPTVTGAVECAVAIQTELARENLPVPAAQRVQFRVGVNLGEVIVDRNDIYGDGVNVAARLEGIAEPGGICISGTVHDAVGGKLNLAYEYLGEQSVKNIAQPVRAFRIVLEPRQGESAILDALGKRWKIATMAALIVALASGIGSYLYLRTPAGAPRSPTPVAIVQAQKDSIAVLPFSNLSGDGEQEYFSDGITNDLITDLSQLSNLMVIASHSVFVYKGSPVKVQQVAVDLGVRYVLEGSVQKSGSRVRINAQLIDAATGHQLWAERFDRQLNDIFALQDDVSRKIVAALSLELTPEEDQRLGGAAETSPEAYDLFLRGLEWYRRYTRDSNAEARALFLRAIEHDPGFARAHADVALTYAMNFLFGWEEPSQALVTEALGYAHKALELNDSQPEVLFSLAVLYLTTQAVEKSIELSARAVQLNPNYADGYAQLSQALVYGGRAEESLEVMDRAMELNPRYAFFYTYIQGHAYLVLRRYEEAIAAFEDVIERNAHFDGAHLTLAVAFAETGRMDEAAWQASEVLSLRPDFSLRKERERIPYVRDEDRDRYIEGLRKAGLPE